ncbi:tetratricopeptide repeat protein [Streptomyces sp. NPDC012769]|uniref:tetratricopeptide repeat protein n=1 Tax=Streptomyces sp. NPDC012769 TaxID=3364848 RepID=UPI0036971B98
MAGRRMLVLLDDARDAEQVRPLLPGSPESLTLVTSRRRIAGLVVRDGAQWLPVQPLSPEEAGKLLAAALGDRRVAAEPREAARLGALCSYTPLALRIAAVNVLGMAASPTPIADYVSRLLDEDRRLTRLSVEEDELSCMKAVFSLSYALLSADERLVFRAGSLVAGPSFTVDAVAAMLDWPPQRATQVLKRLTAARMLEPADGQAYAFHDLLRLFAGRCAAEDGADGWDREESLDRLYAFYVAVSDRAARQLYAEKIRVTEDLPASPVGPPIADPAAAGDWLERELAGLVGAVRRGLGLGRVRPVWQLCDILRGYFWLCRRSADWIVVSRCGVEAARADGHVLGEAVALMSLGDAHRSVGRYGEARRHYEEMLRLVERERQPEWRAQALNSLGLVYILTGRLRDAGCHLEEALGSLPDDLRWRRLRFVIAEGILARERGSLAEAESLHTESLAVSRSHGLHGPESVSLANRGETRLLLGDLDGALDDLTTALALHRQAVNRGSEAELLRDLAELHRLRGDTGSALDLVGAAHRLAAEIGDGRLESSVLHTLGSVHLARGDLATAAGHFADALRVAGEVGARVTETMALHGQAEALLLQGDTAGAHPLVHRALECAHRGGYRVWEGKARVLLARWLLSQGDPAGAVREAEEAVSIQESTGHRLGAAAARAVLDRARTAPTGREASCGGAELACGMPRARRAGR